MSERGFENNLFVSELKNIFKVFDTFLIENSPLKWQFELRSIQLV